MTLQCVFSSNSTNSNMSEIREEESERRSEILCCLLLKMITMPSFAVPPLEIADSRSMIMCEKNIFNKIITTAAKGKEQIKPNIRTDNVNRLNGYALAQRCHVSHKLKVSQRPVDRDR